MKLGLEMCVLPWGILIQACLTQYQVRVRMSQKKCPKWPFLAVFGLKPILNLEISLEFSHAHVLEPNLAVCKKYEAVKILRYLNFEKNGFFFNFFYEKKCCYPPKM